MTTFYKSQFKPFFEQWKASKKNTNASVLTHVVDYIRASFPGLMNTMTEK